MTLVIGCDAYGYALKEVVKRRLAERGIPAEDLGVHGERESRAYYDIAFEAASRLARGEASRAVLVCGTGMGMAIVANKLPGVYAAVCENPRAAKHARSINNANVLTLGGLVTPPETASEIVDTWLDTDFTAGWEPSIQEFLRRSMADIAVLEQKASRLNEGRKA